MIRLIFLLFPIVVSSKTIYLELTVLNSSGDELTLKKVESHSFFSEPDHPFLENNFQELISLGSFTISIIEDGIKSRNLIEVIEKGKKKGLVYFKTNKSTEFLRIEIEAKNHKKWNRNIVLNSDDSFKINLGKIELVPSSLRIENILTHRSAIGSTLYELTLRNIALTENFIDEIGIIFYCDVSGISCFSRSLHKFLVIDGDVNVYNSMNIGANQKLTSFNGSLKSDSDELRESSTVYHGSFLTRCGEYYSLILDIKTSIVLRGEEFSKIIVEIPDTLLMDRGSLGVKYKPSQIRTTHFEEIVFGISTSDKNHPKISKGYYKGQCEK